MHHTHTSTVKQGTMKMRGDEVDEIRKYFMRSDKIYPIMAFTSRARTFVYATGNKRGKSMDKYLQ